MLRRREERRLCSNLFLLEGARNLLNRKDIFAFNWVESRRGHFGMGCQRHDIWFDGLFRFFYGCGYDLWLFRLILRLFRNLSNLLLLLLVVTQSQMRGPSPDFLHGVDFGFLELVIRVGDVIFPICLDPHKAVEVKLPLE